jgi:hypothetical protein
MSQPPSNYLTSQENVDDDYFGLLAWAASRGIEPHVALALVGSTLIGMAGRVGSFAHAPLPGGGGLSLLVREGEIAVSMVIEEITARAIADQAALVAKAKTVSRQEIDEAMFRTGQLSRNVDIVEKLANPREVEQSIQDIDAETKLRYDLQVPEQSSLYQNLTRPRFLLTGALPATKLAQTLAGCHDGRGFSAGAVVSLPASPAKCAALVGEIRQCIAGTVVALLAKRTPTPITQETVALSGILRMVGADFDRVLADHRELAVIALPIAASAISVDEAEIDDDRARDFLRLVLNTARDALAYRRANTSLNLGFKSGAAEKEFLRCQRAYVRELQQVPENCRVHGAASLPAALAWALLFLEGGEIYNDYVIRTAFAAARKLHADAVGLFHARDNAALAEQQLAMAHKLVDLLTRKGPSKRRELVRCLNNQSLHVHGPVINVLIQLGIVIERQDRVLEVGKVPVNTLAASNLINIHP